MRIDYSQTYVYKLHTLTSTLDKAFDIVLIKYADISFSQFSLLLGVAQFESASQQSIANFLQVTSSAVSRQVDLANKNGYLVVNAVKNNRRKNCISLTPKGHNIIQKGHEVLENHLFKIFADGDKSLGLVQHIDLLFYNAKGVIDEQIGKNKNDFPIKVHHINRKDNIMSDQIPKARKLFRGDINDAVIRVQQSTGIEITPAWWNQHVGNDGSTESILDRFDKYYPELVAEKLKNKK